MRFKYFYESVKNELNYDLFKSLFDSLFEKSKMKESSKSTETKLYSKNRTEARDKFVDALKKKNISFDEEITSISSVPVIKIKGDDKRIHKFIFKPIGGGGTHETTLNASITELFPALMFIHKIDSKDPQDVIERLSKLDLNKSSVFVSKQDVTAGLDTINRAKESKKFDEKFDNAIAIYNYLKDLNKEKKIANVWWAYRTKPVGVSKNNPGDLIVKFTDGQMLGISLKAGTKSSKEPQLNTFVVPVMNFFEDSLEKLNKSLWSSVYSKIKGYTYEDFKKKSQNFKNALRDYEAKNATEYNKLYDKALIMIKDAVERDFKNKDKFVAFVKDKILNDNDIPVKVIKAVGKTYHEVKDKNVLDDALPTITGIDVKQASTAKQDLYVIIKQANADDVIMKWSIRTNKPVGSNKLHQVPNLAVKFNGTVDKIK